MSVRHDLDSRLNERLRTVISDHFTLYKVAELSPVEAMQDAFCALAYNLIRIAKVSQIDPDELSSALASSLKSYIAAIEKEESQQ